MTDAMPATAETLSPARIPRSWLWVLLAGGLVLSFAFPNEIIPGALGDRPPAVLAWLALVPLLWGMLTLPSRQARWGAWLYGLVFYLGTVSWMRLFGYLPWVLLAAYLSLTPLFAVLLTQRARAHGWMRPLLFAAAWAASEWLRGQGMFGLAWSELGMSQVDGLPARMASLGGIPLISFLMLWVTGAVVQAVIDRQASRRAALIPVGVLALCLVGGWIQTHAAVARWLHQQRAMVVAVVQPSTQRGLTPAEFRAPKTAAEAEAREAKRRKRLVDLLALSDQAATAGEFASAPRKLPRLLIWSESAIADQPYEPSISQLCQDNASHLIVGAPYVRFFNNGSYQMRNSAYLFGPQGYEEGRYDKMHLVPFGEFVPFRRLVSRFYSVRGEDLARGERRRNLTIAGHRVGVGICFESTCPDIARAYADQGAHFLVYITNDAWFLRTSAVRQHFNQARFRAVESGLPVARTASTGVSGFVRPDGRVTAELPVDAVGTRTMTLRDGIAGTVYSRIGWLFGPLLLLFSVVMAVRGALSARRSS